MMMVVVCGLMDKCGCGMGWVRMRKSQKNLFISYIYKNCRKNYIFLHSHPLSFFQGEMRDHMSESELMEPITNNHPHYPSSPSSKNYNHTTIG